MRISFEVFLKENTIIVESVDESFDTISIEIDNFWDWVKKNELNAFCVDYHDPSENDGHGQRSGYITIEEYFTQNHSLIENDLITYLQKTNKT